jgi:hypothetical protein
MRRALLQRLANDALGSRNAEVGPASLPAPALGASDGGAGLAEGATIDRVTLDVDLDGRREVVTLWVREGALVWSCTSSPASAGSTRPSRHVEAALRWVAGTPDLGPRVDRPLESLRPPVTEVGGVEVHSAVPDVARALASALEDLTTSIVRAGIAASDSPGVRDAIQRVASVVSPTPLDLARWIARLELAMTTRDIVDAARLLDGASHVCEELLDGSAGPRSRAWLGGEASAHEGRVDGHFVEVARESLDGAPRGAIERRYLVDLHSGEIVREERLRDEAPPSLGPCPRVLAVSLAELEPGPPPRRVHLRHYTVRLELTPSERARLTALSAPSLQVASGRHEEALRAWPGLAESVVMIACRSNATGAPEDAEGHPLPLSEHEAPGATAALLEYAARRNEYWVAARLTGSGADLRLVPCAAGDDQGLHRLV